MNRPTCDNDCTRMGWKQFFLSSMEGHELDVSVAPDTDLDGTFEAFDHAEQEIIRINGWLFAATPIDDEDRQCVQCGIRCESGFIDDDGYCDECNPWEEHTSYPCQISHNYYTAEDVARALFVSDYQENDSWALYAVGKRGDLAVLANCDVEHASDTMKSKNC